MSGGTPKTEKSMERKSAIGLRISPSHRMEEQLQLERYKSQCSQHTSCSQTSSAMDKDKTLNIDRSETINPLDGEKSLNTGILFYPSTTILKSGDAKDEVVTEYQQPSGLDPTAIFKVVITDADASKLAPEQSITLFALRLAMIEKTASGIGTLSFIWATTIILGGFAANVNPLDFLVVTVILVTEGARIFTRSRELEWHHVASKSTSESSQLPYQIKNQKMKYGLQNMQWKGSRRGQGEPPEPQESATGVPKGSSEKSGYGEEQSQPTYMRSITVRIDERGEARSLPPELEEDNAAGSSSVYPRIPMTRASSHVKLWNPKVRAGTCFLTNLCAKPRTRTWSYPTSMLPGGFSSILSTRGVSALLYWVQLTSALICFVLSCWRLSKQEFNPKKVTKEETPVNLFLSVNIFYILALTEATLFLLERAYLVYKIHFEHLLAQVNGKAELGDENQETIKQFFYDVYKKCIDGSVFDGLDMDLVEYSLALLQSDNSFEQLGGLKVLRKIVDRNDGFSVDALRRIGTTPGVIERLVDMLSWRSSQQEEIRKEVASLICRVVRYSKNCFRIAAVPGAMEGIVSLLISHDRKGDESAGDESAVTTMERSEYPTNSDPELQSQALRLDGLRILVALARDNANLRRIGETRGLVPILVFSISVKEVHRFKKMVGNEFKTFKKALRLLAMLAAARDVSGDFLRPVIARVVSGIANLRDILEFGDCHPQLQWMAIEVLTNLALDDPIRRTIGSTGGIIRNLFMLYINFDGSSEAPPASASPIPPFYGTDPKSEDSRKELKAVSKRAGHALNLLATQNRKNCLRMMELQDRGSNLGERPFISALMKLIGEHREQTISAAKILRSLMEYSNELQKREIAICSPRVMHLVMRSASLKMQEAVIGLASRVIAVLDEPTYNEIFSNFDKIQLIQKLMRNLDLHSQASNKFPRIRRHSIEFILVLVKRSPFFLEQFKEEGLEYKLVQTMDTICEAENFVIFSGAEGLIRHSVTMENLVQRSLFEFRRQMRYQEQSSSSRSSSV